MSNIPETKDAAIERITADAERAAEHATTDGRPHAAIAILAAAHAQIRAVAAHTPSQDGEVVTICQAD